MILCRCRAVRVPGSHPTSQASLGRLSVVVLELASQALSGGDGPIVAQLPLGKQKPVSDTLVIAFSVIMSEEFRDDHLEGPLSDHDESRKALPLDRSDPSLRVGGQIWAPRGQADCLDAGRLDDVSE